MADDDDTFPVFAPVEPPETGKTNAYMREWMRKWREDPANRQKSRDADKRYRSREEVKAAKREYMLMWKAQNKDKVHASYERSKKKKYLTSENERAYAKNVKFTKPQFYMWTHLKSKSKRLGIQFNIEVEDLTIPEFCPVLGIKLEHGQRGFHHNSPSVDRIIPELGYTKGNVRVVSQRANYLRRDGTAEELEAVARYSRALHNETQLDQQWLGVL